MIALLPVLLAVACESATETPTESVPLAGTTSVEVSAISQLKVTRLAVGETIDLNGASALQVLRRSGGPVWRSLDADVAVVSAVGRATGRANGATLAVASDRGIVDTLVVQVGSGPGSLIASSDTLRISRVGDTASLGLTSLSYSPTLVPSVSGVVNVLPDGRVVAIAPGATSVSARNLVGAAGARAVRVAAPSTPPSAPQPATKTIDAVVHRRVTGTGVVTVSSGIPLPVGLLMPTDLSTVRVLVNGYEQQVFVSALEGRNADGSLSAVLVRFRYDATAADIPAKILIGGAQRTTVDISEPTDDRGTPAAVLLPSSPTYLVETGLLSPTLTKDETAFSYGSYGARYDSDFAQFSEYQFVNNGEDWGQNYYDRAQAYWAMWLRTGNPHYWDRAATQLVNWRRGYLEANNYGTSPHWSQVDGLGLHYLLTGDESSRLAIQRITQTFWWFRVNVGLGEKNSPDIESRIRARVLSAHLWYWRLAPTTARAAIAAEIDVMLSAILGAQEADGSYVYTAYCSQSLPYMDGMLNEALIQVFSRFRADQRIVTSVQRSTNWLWTQWVPSAKAFKYGPNPCTSAVTTDPVPELNHLIVNGFAWLQAVTGDQVARGRAIQVFQGGIDGSFPWGSKQFNQEFSVGWRYFGYMSGMR